MHRNFSSLKESTLIVLNISHLLQYNKKQLFFRFVQKQKTKNKNQMDAISMKQLYDEKQNELKQIEQEKEKESQRVKHERMQYLSGCGHQFTDIMIMDMEKNLKFPFISQLTFRSDISGEEQDLIIDVIKKRLESLGYQCYMKKHRKILIINLPTKVPRCLLRSSKIKLTTEEKISLVGSPPTYEEATKLAKCQCVVS